MICSPGRARADCRPRGSESRITSRKGRNGRTGSPDLLGLPEPAPTPTVRVGDGCGRPAGSVPDIGRWRLPCAASWPANSTAVPTTRSCKTIWPAARLTDQGPFGPWAPQRRRPGPPAGHWQLGRPRQPHTESLSHGYPSLPVKLLSHQMTLSPTQTRPAFPELRPEPAGVSIA